ncbi:MAG: LacI family DNA-binding transcriptional regulator [Rhizobiales bacterium]|nr:LacI family DNA-binding transcriptional regulator [Hyphomicrobiales bacterium]MBI3674498.1 LacI family DNA-binding transcriptional regulator [Hyphomicrobiales bacterium]
MLRRPTIADVARRAGLSPAAVSRWLNGSMQLPAATGDKIREAVEALDYRPHAQARRLSRGRSDTIGIVVPDISNPFFAVIAGEAERVATDAGLDLVIWSSRNLITRELACFDRLASGFIDGLILITNHEDDGRLAVAINRNKGRVVIVDEDVRGVHAPRFFVENEDGGYQATKHLIERGHRHILHIGGPSGVMSAIERAAGWKHALADASITPSANWQIFTEYEVGLATEAAAAIFRLSPRPTAVFAGSDAIALGVLTQARAQNVAIPADMSLAGFDGMPIVDLLGPPLTSIAQPIDVLGRLGAEQLIRMLNGAADSAAPIRLPVTLVVRGSVSAPSHRLGFASQTPIHRTGGMIPQSINQGE